MEFFKKPAVDFRQFVNALYCIPLAHGLGHHEDALVGGFAQGLVHVGHFEVAVADEAVHTLTDHAQAFLDYLLEGASDGHNFADGFHRRTDLAPYAMEFAEVPARNLADDIVECRLEESSGIFRHGVLQLEQSVAESEFCGHESQGIACGFRCQSRRAAKSGVYLDYAVVHRVGVVGILHVTFAHDAYMTDNLYGEFAQEVVVVVGERLRGCHYYRFAGVDAKRVEVLHVADGDAVVVAVAHHLVFHLFPPLERFLHEHLRRKRERFLGERGKLLGVVAETAAEASEGIGGAHDHRVAEAFGCLKSLSGSAHSLALYGFYVDFVEFAHEELPVLSVLDGLYGGAEHADTIAFQYARLIKLHTAVERGLASEGQKNAVGALFFYHAFHEVGRYRQEVDFVGKPAGGPHGGDVRIDEHRGDALLFHGFESL